MRNNSGNAYDTHETYSLSVLVVRTSGSLPSRPIRVSLETSYERVEVVEKVFGKFCQHGSILKGTTYATRRASEGLTSGGKHGCDGGLSKRVLTSSKVFDFLDAMFVLVWLFLLKNQCNINSFMMS